jgi:hypothetical protein
MPDTLHLDFTEVGHIAKQVGDAAGIIAATGRSLRLRIPAPATDPQSLSLYARSHHERMRLAYVADAAADELLRAIEAVLLYANNARILAQRTELAVMGLDVPVIEAETMTTITHAYPSREPAPIHDRAVCGESDSGTLSNAVLLAAGPESLAHECIPVTHLHEAAEQLHDGAGRLRAAMSSGEGPAAMLDRFGHWVSADFIPAVCALDEGIAAWFGAYLRVRERVAEPAGVYRRWLAAVVAGGGDQAEVARAAARARQALRDYTAVGVEDVAVASFPQVGVGAARGPVG